jgi:prepilin-type N-terminal cleavage/methylation domain-containing protein
MRKGFTLVELSIVLIIIGLLIGGVLKGREMIDNAKRKRVKSDVDGITAAIYSYQDKYGYIPGDDPEDRTSDLGATGCTGGNNDGVIRDAELSCIWQELAGAGLITGDPTKTDNTPKNHPFNGKYKLEVCSDGVGNCIKMSRMPKDVAAYLDRQYDDGTYNTGDITGDGDYTGSGTIELRWKTF